MPVQTYKLDPENPKRLDISYRSFWRGATVYLDGKEIGTAPDKQALLKGQAFKLPDGSTLKLKLIQRITGSELHVLRNGQPVLGSASHPETAIKSAYWALLLIAAMNILFGVVARVLQLNMLGEMGIGDFSIAFGVIYIILSYFVRRHSLPALYAGVALFAADTVLGLVLTATSGGAPSTYNIIFRGLIFIPLLQGVGGMRDLKAAERALG